MNGFVPPAYTDRSLGDVLPAVARALGVDAGLPPSRLDLPEARSYIVFLVDGLGHQLLREHPTEAPFLHAHLGEPATVGVPSTTATSLTSLGTALTPGSHGVVGFTTSLRFVDGFRNVPWTLAFLVSVAISMGLLEVASRSIPMGTAYAVWGGIGAVGTVLIGILWFQEPSSTIRILLILGIVAAIAALKLTA